MGVPLTAPHPPERMLHSLPTTLCTQGQNSIPDCSKAPGVFPSSRRYPASSPGLHFHRAAPRDSAPVVKPFMRAETYSARDYATFGPSELGPTFTGASLSQLPPQFFVGGTAEFNEPALVRPQPLYILFRVKQGPVFLINSRQGNFRCAPAKSKAYAGEALSRSYGRLFAEFLWELSPVHLGTLTPAHLCRFCGTDPSLIDISIFRYIENGAFLGRLLVRVHPKWASPWSLDFYKEILRQGTRIH